MYFQHLLDFYKKNIKFGYLFSGSPNGHSPVLNLSKSGGNGGGSLGSNDGDNDPDHSGSEADGPETALPVGEPHSPRSNSEHEEDEQLSDPEEEDEKDQGMFIYITTANVILKSRIKLSI